MRFRFSHIIIIFLAIVCLSSCEKKEEPIVLPGKQNDSLRLGRVSMGNTYTNQVFINLETFETRSIDIHSWDLSFDAQPNGYLIYLNGGSGVLSASIGKGNFSVMPDVNKINWRWDAANGMSDSLVLGKWCNGSTYVGNDSVYVIDRGQETKSGDRYYQFKIKYANAYQYVLEIANLQGNVLGEKVIAKDADKAHVYFSFGNDGYQNPEPSISNWHLCFLRYRWVYYEFNPPLLYTVSGIYINTHQVEVYLDSSSVFNNIQFASAVNYQFSKMRDVMGFDWKVYNFTTSKYVARSYVNYVLRIKQPLTYYKMRFIDFYNEQGLKGTPVFEIEEL
jgi:hypothetical protein